ncbi:PepSY-associated TM helix domain-containing protein [Pseudoxanthomonas dokdonensis]|uniref:Membrane protein n=1 Tax=Pseudoxanthomonas dokdonensis TaxID=344882 RepID=A0A0R0CWZ0_9GAMM|nr:PepSY-associated TM helix domain-containing protein [Pseudoxanthomonas dokdonensis]KRG70906.1 membrane protein [Pseudoxanthomonas dokdonensis]
MKIKSATLRTFTTLHTWVGLVAGFALFVAFYAGAITVFHHDLMLWQSPPAATMAVESIDDAQRLLDDTLREHPEARAHVGMLFPGAESPQALIYWQDTAGSWWYDTNTGAPSETPPGGGLSELINRLHFSLGIPLAGTYLMGIVSLLYGLALISGVVIHLPRLLPDLFALRPGRNLKRFWQDAHNVIGVLGLPMHIMFAVTGAMLCLLMIAAMALNPLIYDGKLMQAMPAALDTAPVVQPAGTRVEDQRLRGWLQRATDTALEQGVASFEPAYMKLANAGDANATIEITGASPGTLGPLGAVALNAHSGQVLATQLPGRRDANHATLAAAYALHFGEYGNRWVAWLYFLLGLGGAFLFYSGNLLWVESRRKRRQPAQSRASLNMARATVGVCIGFCVAVSAAFLASQLAWLVGIRDDAVSSRVIEWACFTSWAGCAAWAALRPPVRAAIELLWLAALVSALVPVAHGLASGDWLWTSASQGHWALFCIDAGALALAAGFVALARASTRRARDGDPNSVWAQRLP